MEARVLTVLQRKGNRVITVTPQQTIRSVVEVLNTNRIGAAPVINDEGRLVGMVSERDVIRGLGQYAGEKYSRKSKTFRGTFARRRRGRVRGLSDMLDSQSLR